MFIYHAIAITWDAIGHNLVSQFIQCSYNVSILGALPEELLVEVGGRHWHVGSIGRLGHDTFAGGARGETRKYYITAHEFYNTFKIISLSVHFYEIRLQHWQIRFKIEKRRVNSFISLVTTRFPSQRMKHWHWLPVPSTRSRPLQLTTYNLLITPHVP